MVIAICGVIFALGLDKESSFYIRLSRTLVPRGTAIWSGAYWGLLTSAFVHGAFWHILFNMWWLKDFGALLEPTMGQIKYLLFILAAAIISSGAELAFNNDTGIGFSGVVYAMFGYALAARHVIPLYQQLVSKQTIVWLLGWLALCIILTVTGVWNVANGSQHRRVPFRLLYRQRIHRTGLYNAQQARSDASDRIDSPLGDVYAMVGGMEATRWHCMERKGNIFV